MAPATSTRCTSYNQKGDSASAAVSAPVVAGTTTPATSVALAVSTAPAVSSTFGTAGIVFTATPTGGANHEFQFLVNGAIVQDYSATATYGFTTTQPVGVYTVAVNVRTSLASAIVSNSLGYTITAGPATGVQLLPNLPSPQLASKNIKFTATGIGSTGYQYQFYVDGVIAQPYSATNTYTLPTSTFATTHVIKVDVSTAAVPATADATATLNYTISNPAPATGVTLTPSLSSPRAIGTAVTFTAAGQGSSGYQYRVLAHPQWWRWNHGPGLQQHRYVGHAYINACWNL